MQKYKLTKKVNPQKRNDPPKWYAIPVRGRTSETVKAMTQAATKNTTTAPTELESSLELFGKYAESRLKEGLPVRVGDLGTLEITFGSTGVESVQKFNPVTHIRNVRILFTPSKKFREEVIGKIQFENGGVLEDNITYASVKDYNRAKGIPDDGGGEEGGGDDVLS